MTKFEIDGKPAPVLYAPMGVNISPHKVNAVPNSGDMKLALIRGKLRGIDGDARRYKLQCETGTPVNGVTGVPQVETATVIAASGATDNGNLAVIVTGAVLVGTPVTYAIPVTTASNTAALVAGVIRTYLGTQTAITDVYTVGGTGADVVLTTRATVANDSSLNISIATGTATGITTAATSTNTTAGVATVLPTLASAGDLMQDGSYIYVATTDVNAGSTSGWKKAALS